MILRKKAPGFFKKLAIILVFYPGLLYLHRIIVAHATNARLGRKNLELSEKQQLGKNISILDRYSQIILDGELSPLHLNHRQMVFMIHLYMKEGIHLEELARIYQVNRATVTRAIRSLEQEGYLRKRVDKANAKAYKLYVTEEGFAVRQRLMNAFNRWIDFLTEGFSDEEIRTAVTLISRMAVKACTWKGDVVCGKGTK